MIIPFSLSQIFVIKCHFAILSAATLDCMQGRYYYYYYV